jgi:hypothetical protein
MRRAPIRGLCTLRPLHEERFGHNREYTQGRSRSSRGSADPSGFIGLGAIVNLATIQIRVFVGNSIIAGNTQNVA